MGKSINFLSFSCIYLVNILIVVAQPNFYDFVCDPTSNYTTNTTYQTNLQRSLNDLPTTNSGSGFFNFSSGQNPDKVNAIALCRGDIKPVSCDSCVNNSIVKLRQVCPNKKSASGYYENCTIKYSNEDMLGKIGVDYRHVGGGSGINATDVVGFHHDVLELMDKLTSSAAREGPLLKYASDTKTKSDSKIIYGVVQCTPDLSKQQCSECLKIAVGLIAGCCYGNTGARVLLPSCNLRYEDYQFYDVAKPINPSQPPSSSLQQVPFPATGGRNKNMMFLALTLVMASIFIF